MWRFMVSAMMVAMASLQMAQPAAAQAPDQTAEKTFHLDLDRLVSIKPARAETPSVIVGFPVDEQRTRTVQVTKLRQEQRTRIVNVDGKPVEQNYVVAVPYTERVEQTYIARVFSDETVSVLKIAGWDLQGNRISDQELIDRLANHPVAFLLEKPWPDGAELDPQQRAVLRDDVLMLHVPQKHRPQPRAAK